MNLEFVVEENFEMVMNLNQTGHDAHYDILPTIFEPYDKEKTRLWLVNFFQNPDNFSVFIKKDQNYIGYALLTHQHKPYNNPFIHSNFSVLHINQMSIEKEYQNMGIGAQLMAFIKELAKERGAKKILLEVWSENKQAKHFYKKNGFETSRERMELTIK